MAKKTPYLVVTASRTDDGAPVYFRADKSWSERIAEADVVESESVAQELVAVARGQERAVCDPYTMYVERAGDGSAVPVTARERIRSVGPTTPLRRPDHELRS